MITVLHRGGYAQMITILHRGGGGGRVSRDPQKWLRNMCTTPHDEGVYDTVCGEWGLFPPIQELWVRSSNYLNDKDRLASPYFHNDNDISCYRWWSWGERELIKMFCRWSFENRQLWRSEWALHPPPLFCGRIYTRRAPKVTCGSLHKNRPHPHGRWYHVRL